MIADGSRTSSGGPGPEPAAPGRFKIGTAARAAGVKPATLRNWEQRFGLLEPVRGPGGQRLYTDDDLSVLREVRRALDRGASIGEIALRGRKELLEAATRRRGSPPVVDAAVSEPRPIAGDDHEILAELADEILEAALELDAQRLQRALDEAFDRFDAGVVLAQVAEPVSKELGQLWLAGACGVASEHLATGAIRARMQQLVEAGQRSVPAEAPLAFTCCLPDELHELGALRVAYHLTQVGVRVVHLGSTLPLEDLELAIRRLEPRFVFLSVTRPATLEAHAPRLEDLVLRWSERVHFILGGAGVDAARSDLAAPNLTVHDPRRDLSAELRRWVGL